MTDWTEQWKKGELPDGWYYTEIDLYENGDYIEIIPNTYNDCFEYGIVKQVIAPVPSYEEWQDLKSKLQLKETACDFDTARLEEENTKLKELLIECRSPINYALCLNLSEEEKIEFKNLLAKIKQILGEE